MSLDILTLEYETATLSRNGGHKSSTDAAPHLTSTEPLQKNEKKTGDTYEVTLWRVCLCRQEYKYTDRQYMYNIILWRIHVIIVAMEMQRLPFFIVELRMQ
jgi:hypothetical protein